MACDSDDYKPEYMFNGTPTQLLVQIANGEIDPVALAKATLANRCLDNNGEWVGRSRLDELIAKHRK